MAKWARETPWRQGRLLTEETAAALQLIHHEYPGETVVIVATHDCDLAQTPESEPMIEVVVGRRIDLMDGNYTHAKTARTLHSQFKGTSPLMAEFIITDKLSIHKEALADFEPLDSHHLSASGQVTFQRWLASRYRRSAFPDEFERRLVHESKLASKIAKAVKPHGELIAAVLFDVDEGEETTKNGPDDTYLLDITLLYPAEADINRATAAAETAKKAIQKAFLDKLFNKESGEWRNIELRYCEVMSDEALSYHHFSLMKPWRLEYISLGADQQQSIPTD